MPLRDPHGEIIQQPDVFDPEGISSLDVELCGRMADEIRVLQSGEPLVVALSGISAVQLAGLLQLALRHDGLAHGIRLTAFRFLDAVRVYFAASPAVLDVLARGDDPRYDR